jgi:quercetin 2,3-dioxygenase
MPIISQNGLNDLNVWNDLNSALNGGVGTVTVHQDMELLVVVLDPGQQVNYSLKPGRHAWLQLARGGVSVNGTKLNAGDGAAVSEEGVLEVKALDTAELLIFDLA